MDLLANWLWQGCAVALATSVVLRLCPRLSATTRYRVWWVALGLVLMLPLVRAWPLLDAPQPVAIVSPVSLAVPLPPLPWWPPALMFAAWSLWAIGSLVRLAGALMALRRAKAMSSPFPPAREARMPGWLSVRRSGRHAALVVSEEVRAAGVLGLRAPAVAVAPVMLRELSDGELDQILVHEWAHVQRRDDIGGLCQVLVTAVAGLHPAVWWIDRQLHVERETACDDWTINVTGAPKGYAACLTKLATMGNEGLLVPAAWSSSTLKTRVVRLLDRRRNRSTRYTVTSLAIAPVLAAIALGAASVELVLNRPPGPPAAKKVAGTFASGTRNASRSLASQPALKKVPATFFERGERETEAVPVVATQEADVGDAHPPVPAFDATALEAAALPGSSEPAPTIADIARIHTSSTAANTRWGAAADAGVAVADAGVAVGRGSKKGAVATAGFFTRMGKSIAGAF